MTWRPLASHSIVAAAEVGLLRRPRLGNARPLHICVTFHLWCASLSLQQRNLRNMAQHAYACSARGLFVVVSKTFARVRSALEHAYVLSNSFSLSLFAALQASQGAGPGPLSQEAAERGLLRLDKIHFEALQRWWDEKCEAGERAQRMPIKFAER